MSKFYQNCFMLNNHQLHLDSGISLTGHKGNVYLNDRLYALGVDKPIECIEIPPEIKDKTELIVFQQPEGPLVRVYWFENTWMVSTSGKLNANSSFWGSSTSFGAVFSRYLADIFDNPTASFWSQLDKNFAYWFYLQPDENSRIVLKPTSSNGSDNLIYVGCLKLYETSMSAFDFSNKFDKIRAVEYNIDIFTGPIIALRVYDLETNKVYKIWNKSYLAQNKIRGNDAHLDRQYCYWQLTRPDIADQFLQQYPEKRDMLTEKMWTLMIFTHKMKEKILTTRTGYEVYDKNVKKILDCQPYQRLVQLQPKDLALLILGNLNWSAIYIRR